MFFWGSKRLPFWKDAVRLNCVRSVVSRGGKGLLAVAADAAMTDATRVSLSTLSFFISHLTRRRTVLHYSCDLCQRPIDPDLGIRHVVKISVFPAVNLHDHEEAASVAAESASGDHLDDMHDLLEQLEEQDLAAFLDDGTRTLRFDLCEGCRQRFLRNPLGAKPNKSLTFSNN